MAHINILFTRTDNKVRELTTGYLPWQQWTKTLVWVDDVGILTFHSCVVDLWQSLSEWRLVCFGVLHHDNAPTHTALSVREFLDSKQITVLKHLAYLPAVAPSDIFLFPKIKEIFKGRHFDDSDDIRSNMTTNTQDHFQNYSEGWTRH
jgi:hypothetical protein